MMIIIIIPIIERRASWFTLTTFCSCVDFGDNTYLLCKRYEVEQKCSSRTQGLRGQSRSPEEVKGSIRSGHNTMVITKNIFEITKCNYFHYFFFFMRIITLYSINLLNMIITHMNICLKIKNVKNHITFIYLVIFENGRSKIKFRLRA